MLFTLLQTANLLKVVVSGLPYTEVTVKDFMPTITMKLHTDDRIKVYSTLQKRKNEIEHPS